MQTYNALKDVDYELEIIFISFDRDENGFKEHMKSMPWLVVPFDVNLQKKLGNLYKVNQIPSFIPLNIDTKLLAKDSVGLIKDYGPDAFPFTKKRQEELKAFDEAKRQEGKLEHLFTNGIDSKGEKVRNLGFIGFSISYQDWISLKLFVFLFVDMFIGTCGQDDWSLLWCKLVSTMS